MAIPLGRVLLTVVLASAALCAQGGKRPADLPGPKKDDAITKKDQAVVAIDKFLKRRKVSKKRPDWRTKLSVPPQQEFAADRDYRWHMATNKGEITIRFLPDAAPMHVTNTIYLARAGFYDGLTFHRVIKGFMAQGGCPLGTGNGNAGYMIKGECTPAAKHDKPGILSTANEEGKPKTDGSQFFLTFAPTPHLDGKHTVFGEVVAGMAVVEAIDACGGDASSGKPTEPIEIVRTWIAVIEKPPAAAGAEDDGGKQRGGKSDGR